MHLTPVVIAGHIYMMVMTTVSATVRTPTEALTILLPAFQKWRSGFQYGTLSKPSQDCSRHFDLMLFHLMRFHLIPVRDQLL